MKGFLMNLDTAIEFWERCIEANAKTEDERLSVMNKLLHDKDVTIIKEDQFKKVLKDKKVLVVKKENKHVS